MILGRGTAHTDEAILAEYHLFLSTSSGITTDRVRNRVGVAAGTVCNRIGKPITTWTEDDILALFPGRSKGVVYGYSAFVAFLLFRGYVRVRRIAFFRALPIGLSRLHAPALQPMRQRLETTRKALDYAAEGLETRDTSGTVLSILIYLLAYVGKPLNEVTRVDFNDFRTAYNYWYVEVERRSHTSGDPRLARLERYLVHWEVLPLQRPVFKHEEHFASLQHDAIKNAILHYMRWCDAKYQPSTIHSCRAAVLNFFVWLQAHYASVTRLDTVSRPIALEYAVYLNKKREAGIYSRKYVVDLYRRIRLFFEFVIVEQVATAPGRNPFVLGDTSYEGDPAPRYLTDQEIQVILRYCSTEATLVERVIVMTLLHTGIRACEFVDLKKTDIVQIQGQWKLHIHEGKGLKDRIIPLTAPCRELLQKWQEQGWEKATDYLFTTHGRQWRTHKVGTIVRELGLKLKITGLTPHRFRHTFAVALLNYGIRESALQKLMGHKTLGMTLEYARILDTSVERAFTDAVTEMQDGPRSWVPSFFVTEEYTLFAEGDSISWIRLPIGYCRRNPKLHCESDVKCLLCDRFAVAPEDLARLREMHARFVRLGLQVKADVVAAQIRRLEAPQEDQFIVLEPTVSPATRMTVPPQPAEGHPDESRLRGGH